MREQQPTPDNTKTSERQVAVVEKRINSLQISGAKLLEQLNDNNWGKEKLLPHLLTFKDLVKGMTLAGVPTTALLLATLELNYHRTRWRVETVPAGQELEYRHEDAETTAILNYFAGRGSLPKHIELAIYREGIAKIAQANGHTLPEDFATMDEPSLKSLLIEYFTPGPHDRAHFSSPQQMTETFFLHAIPTYKKNDRLYELLWKLEQEVGNPKIRFSFIEKDEDEEERAFYRAPTNTAYIFQHNPFSDLVAEFAHAEQFDRDHLGSTLLAVRGGFESGVEMLSKGISFGKAYDATQYPTPGTLEYHAHQQIEPALWGKLGGVKPVVEKDTDTEPKKMTRR